MVGAQQIEGEGLAHGPMQRRSRIILPGLARWIGKVMLGSRCRDRRWG